MVAGTGFEPMTFGLCLPLQLSLSELLSLWSGLSLYPRHSKTAVRVPPIKSLHLLSQCESLARDYHAKGFPEFERRSHTSFLVCSPLQNELVSSCGIEPNELPDCSTPREMNRLFCEKKQGVTSGFESCHFCAQKCRS